MSIMSEKKCQNCSCETSDDLCNANANIFRNNEAQIKEGEIAVCATCDNCCRERTERLNAVLDSVEDKRLIVAGPGTGKTYTFSEVIKTLPEGSRALVFTLINNLADDLRSELTVIEGREVKAGTFHGYCKELLHSIVSVEGFGNDFSYTPNLPILIEDDARALGFDYGAAGFSRSFSNLNKDDSLNFFVERASYYNAISHTDGVYHTYIYLFNNKDRVPEFDVVIADEFQDFNLLESEFISLLATVNKTLLAGDDDQALYGFRSAKTDFIRGLFNDESLGYEKHYLPYCSRCAPVIVKATNDLVQQATSQGLLVGRIKKDFKPYWPDKYIESSLFPKIHLAKCSTVKTVPRFVEHWINELVDSLSVQPGQNYEFMVIGPENRPDYLTSIKKHLTGSLDGEMYEVVGPKEKSVIDFSEEAYLLLSEGRNTNLAWRMLMREDPPDNLDEIIKCAIDGVRIETLLSAEYVEKHRVLMQEFLDREPEEEKEEEESGRIKILLTNYLGSKGLAANHVIVVGLNNETFPSDAGNITDEEVCKFLVALTRAKKTCALVTNKEYSKERGYLIDRPSSFISWLSASDLESSNYNISKDNINKT